MPASEVFAKWKSGRLHSGGPGGPVVKDQKQAEAIYLSEKKKAAEGNTEYRDHPLKAAFGRPKKRS